nr:protein [Spodoptera litura nucleopolyhedrovirus]
MNIEKSARFDSNVSDFLQTCLNFYTCKNF